MRAALSCAHEALRAAPSVPERDGFLNANGLLAAQRFVVGSILSLMITSVLVPDLGAKFSGPCSSRQLDSKRRHLPVSWGAPHQRRSVSCGTQLLQLVYTCLLCFLLSILASTFSRLPFELYHTPFWDQRQR